MKIERQFLGWDRPALHRTVDTLFEVYCQPGDWDLSEVILVVPGARAGRRLQELLALRAEAQAAGGRAPLLSPPTVVTPGRLPELLYTPPAPLATDLESALARAATLRGAPAETIGALFSAPPGPEDLTGWLRLADEIAGLDQSLAGDGVTYAAVQDYCAALGLTQSVRRWQALLNLRAGYRSALRQAGLLCRLEARENAMANGLGCAAKIIVLVATADLPVVTCQLLSHSDCHVTALIHAPESAAEGFNEFGVLVPGYWQDKVVPIEDEDVLIVDSAAHQAGALTGLLRHAPELTVGVGDEALAPVLQRALALAGHAAHRATSGPLNETAPAQLLTALAAYANAPRADAFAALLRHPDLAATLEADNAAPTPIQPTHTLPGQCDNYRNRHLPASIFAGGLPPELARAVRALDTLLVVPGEKRRPLPEWATPLGSLLATVYQPLLADESTGFVAEVTTALGAFGEALQDLGELAPELAFVPACTFVEAISFVLARFGRAPLPEPMEAAAGEVPIDILGWLEIHLDDAPAAIIAGFNEGLIPDSVGAAAFLPDGLCRELGLQDNVRRYARDAYLLSAIKHSRPALVLLAARHTAAGEPLAPSRLFFACAPDQVARRALAFYDAAANPAPALQEAASDGLAHGTHNTLAAIPRPRRLAQPLQELPVTAFKDYLACPYRFFLRHVLKLADAADNSTEMGGDIFGNLAHAVLADFGTAVIQADGVPPSDADTIIAILNESLDRQAARLFGEPTLPVVRLQLHQLRRRLAAFATWQAGEANEGWRITHVEQRLRQTVTVDGTDFIIEGRLDRIDFHEASGTYRILDYKTSDTGLPPAKTHGSAGAWVDLQLPLYRRLAAALGIPPEAVTVGYIVLPRDLGAVGLAMAPWEAADILDAERCADTVLRAVRDGIFWPPAEALPKYADGFAAICRDAALNRLELFAAPEGPPAAWPDGPHAFRMEAAHAR